MGAELLLSSDNTAELDQIRKLCLKFTPKVTILPLDTSDPAQTLYTAQQVNKRFPIEVLIHTSPIPCKATVFSTITSVKYEKRLFTENYLSQIAVTKAVLPGMVSRKTGQIVHFSSAFALLETPGSCFFGSSKAATSAYLDSLRAEISSCDVQVTNIYPGFVWTQEDNHNDGMTGRQIAGSALRCVYWRLPEAVVCSGKLRIYVVLRVYFRTFMSLFVN